MYVSENGCGWQQRKRDLFLFRGRGDDSDEEDDEDDNDGKADDYDGGDGDDKALQVRQQRPYVSRASRQSLLAHSLLRRNPMHSGAIAL